MRIKNIENKRKQLFTIRSKLLWFLRVIFNFFLILLESAMYANIFCWSVQFSEFHEAHTSSCLSYRQSSFLTCYDNMIRKVGPALGPSKRAINDWSHLSRQSHIPLLVIGLGVDKRLSSGWDERIPLKVFWKIT